MTRKKAEKRATRARMAKTGERYTTARRYALDLHRAPQDALNVASDGQTLLPAELMASADAPEPATNAPALPPRVADPGVSDAAVQRATGKDWDAWLALLDAWGATAKRHPEIARYVHETHGVDGWWAQSVTVGYERARGMRARYERPDGFTVNASKTFPVPVERLFAAIVECEERERWLDGVQLRQRTSKAFSSARFDVLPGETRLAVTFSSRGPGKSTAQFQQERLPSADEVERWRAVWKARLARLADYLGNVPDVS